MREWQISKFTHGSHKYTRKLTAEIIEMSRNLVWVLVEESGPYYLCIVPHNPSSLDAYLGPRHRKETRISFEAER